MADRFVSIIDIAKHLNITKGTVLSCVERLGFPISSIRRPESGQVVRAVSPEAAKAIIAELANKAEFINPEDLLKEE